MMAFAIDTGYMCLAQTELQNAADAAARAGSQSLQPYFVQYYLPGQGNQSGILNNAKAAALAVAKKYSSLNTAAGVNIQLLDADVGFGFLDASGNYTPSAPSFPNSVSVVARRDSLQNGPLALFFGAILGKPRQDLQATARTTMYTGEVSSLQVVPGLRSRMLPVALDINIWQVFYQTGKSPDGKKHPGPNGAYQIQVYPYPKQTSGNFSLLCIGPPDGNSPTFRNWIDNGMAPSDIQYQVDHALVPVSPAAPKPWAGGPGMTDTLGANFADVLNLPNMIPLFRPISTSPYQAADSTGQNSTYNIIGFASVIVSEVSGNGSNLNLSLQPCAVSDASAVYTNVMPAGSGVSTTTGTMQTTFLAPKLTN